MKRNHKKRAPLTPRLLILSGRIWGHCRENRESCDAERHGKVVYDLLREAVQIVVDDRAQVVMQLRATSTALRDLRREVAKDEKNDFDQWVATNVGQGHAKRVGSRVTSLKAAFLAGTKINKPKQRPRPHYWARTSALTQIVVSDSEDKENENG